MKKLQNPFLITLIILISSFSSTLLAQEINLTGNYMRDDGKPRIIEHVEGGIILTTLEKEYFYKRIAKNTYRMEWTPREYSGTYRWTLKVINNEQLTNHYETSSGSYTNDRIYVRLDSTEPLLLTNTEYLPK